MQRHHPNKTLYPDWVLDVGNMQFHKSLTVIQRMRPIPENLAVIRAFIDALEYEYLDKRRRLDTGGGA